jgi:4-hydroxy 2-oxovalerate aldolase
MKVTHLDCTLRDGGYYHNWDFDHNFVNKYLEVMHKSGVNISELGFRFFDNDSFKGSCAYTSDSFLNALTIPKNMKIAIMINLSDLIVDKLVDFQRLDAIIPMDFDHSRLDIIRLACRPGQVDFAVAVSQYLKKKKFTIAINVMQMSELSNENIRDWGMSINTDDVSVLYFADSFGSMRHEKIKTFIETVKKYWPGPIGIHTHDNLGLALINSFCLVDNADNTWIDSSITGMGRGPGNAKTEEVLVELSYRKHLEPKIVDLMNLIDEYFIYWKREMKWGSNAYYYMSGLLGIHPSYIQEMLSDARFDNVDIMSVITSISDKKKVNFDGVTLEDARIFYSHCKPGKSPPNLFYDRKVLLIGTGPSVERYAPEIERLIDSENLLVIALNIQDKIGIKFIDYSIACNPARLVADIDTHLRRKIPLICPFSMLPNELKGSLGNHEVIDYGIKIKKDLFEVDDKFCTISKPLVFAYCLGFLNAANIEGVYLVGFDGYQSSDDYRHLETSQLLQIYNENNENIPLVSITPTKYTIPTLSIFGLNR